MAPAVSTLLRLRRTSALLRTYINSSTSSFSPHRLCSRLPFHFATSGIPLRNQALLHTPRFQTFPFSSSSSTTTTGSSEDSDGDGNWDAAPEISDSEVPTGEGGKQDQTEIGGLTKSSQNVKMREGDWICSECNFMNYARNVRCLECRADGPHQANTEEMKKGDWTCSQCKFMNYARNIRCLRCRSDRPVGEDVGHCIMKKGDWTCPKCNYHNYARNMRCRICNAEKATTFDNLAVKEGDWNCPKCDFLNFARNMECLRCKEPLPKRHLRSGDWECPSCNFFNFSRNEICRKCSCSHPKDESSQQEDYTSGIVKLATEKRMRFGDNDRNNDDIMPLVEADSNSESIKVDNDEPQNIREDSTHEDDIMQLSEDDNRSEDNKRASSA